MDPDPQGQLDALVTALTHLHATRYMQVSACAVMWYDYFLTLKLEVQHFWSGRWTWVRALFFIIRYFALMAITLNTAALLNENITSQFCYVWAIYLLTSTGTLEIFIVQTILCFRILGMYGRGGEAGGIRSTRVMYPLISLFALSTFAAIVILVRALRTATVANVIEGTDIIACHATNQPLDLWAFWIPILVFEATVFVLACYKSYTSIMANRRAGWSGARFMKIILQDSILYFMTILLFYSANGIIWRHAAPSLHEVIHGWSLGLLAILSGRMLLNLRQANTEAQDNTGGQGITTGGVDEFIEFTPIGPQHTLAGSDLDRDEYAARGSWNGRGKRRGSRPRSESVRGRGKGRRRMSDPEDGLDDTEDDRSERPSESKSQISDQHSFASSHRLDPA